MSTDYLSNMLDENESQARFHIQLFKHISRKSYIRFAPVST